MTAKEAKKISNESNNDVLRHSSDILFLMDAVLTNPNGDPFENIPRRCRTEKGDIGEITGVCLGQTIRAYLKDIKVNNSSLPVFVDREAEVLSSGEAFAKFAEKVNEIEKQEDKAQFIADSFMEKFIDVRLFGALITIQEKAQEKLKSLGVVFKQNSIQRTGPVQLGTLGATVHPIVIQKVPITSTFRSKETKGKPDEKDTEQGTRGEKWVVNYGLYQFTPVIDATLAAKTRMKATDKNLFVEALWCGVKTRISGSKTNQLPLLYIEVVYKAGIKGRIGRLSDFVHYKAAKEPQKVSDIQIDMTGLIDVMSKHGSEIEEIRIIEDEDRLSQGIADKLKTTGLKKIVKGDSLTGRFYNNNPQQATEAKTQ